MWVTKRGRSELFHNVCGKYRLQDKNTTKFINSQHDHLTQLEKFLEQIKQMKKVL